MAKNETATATNGTMRAISPPSQRIKRERCSDDEETQTRRVSQRTIVSDTANGNAATNTRNNKSSVTEFVKKISRTDNIQTLKFNLLELQRSLWNSGMSQEQYKANQQAFLRVGGPLAIVMTMNKHPNSEYVQDEAIRILRNATITIYHQGIQNATLYHQEIQKAVGEIDGIQAILSAMTNFPSSRKIQWSGVGALLKLCDLEANAELLVLNLNGTTIITKAMQSFLNDEQTVRVGCILLSDLSEVESLKQKLLDANVLTLLSSAFDNHKGNPDIQHWARKALKKLV